VHVRPYISIEHFFSYDVELDKGGQNCLSYVLSGSEGTVASTEVREMIILSNVERSEVEDDCFFQRSWRFLCCFCFHLRTVDG
jgi:hypothetical protein